MLEFEPCAEYARPFDRGFAHVGGDTRMRGKGGMHERFYYPALRASYGKGVATAGARGAVIAQIAICSFLYKFPGKITSFSDRIATALRTNAGREFHYAEQPNLQTTVLSLSLLITSS